MILLIFAVLLFSKTFRMLLLTILGVMINYIWAIVFVLLFIFMKKR